MNFCCQEIDYASFDPVLPSIMIKLRQVEKLIKLFKKVASYHDCGSLHFSSLPGSFYIKRGRSIIENMTGENGEAIKKLIASTQDKMFMQIKYQIIEEALRVMLIGVDRHDWFAHTLNNMTQLLALYEKYIAFLITNKKRVNLIAQV